MFICPVAAVGIIKRRQFYLNLRFLLKIDVIVTNRSKEVYAHKGFLYIFDRMSGNIITKHYRCRRRDLKCKGQIHVNTGDVLVKETHGSHDESPVDVEVSYIIINIKWIDG